MIPPKLSFILDSVVFPRYQRFFTEKGSNKMADENPEREKNCNIYSDLQTNKATGGFGGIQQHLFVSVAGFVLFMLIFSLLRRRLWDFGVLAVLKRHAAHQDLVDSKLFFEPSGRKIRRPGDPIDTSAYTKPPEFKGPTSAHRARLRWWARQKELDQAILDDKSLFGWIRVTWSLDDEDILHGSGPDCLKYLIFQKHLIFISVIWTTLALCTLPVNMLGTVTVEQLAVNVSTMVDNNGTELTVGDVPEERFLRLGLINLQSAAQYIVVHLTLLTVLSFITVAVLRRFSEYLVYYDDYDDDKYRSVFVRGITTLHSARISENTIREHLQSIYPGVEIREILLIYNYSELFTHYNYLRLVHQALLYYEAYGQTYGRVPRIVGCCCGICCYYKFCICRLCCSTTNALDFYEDEEVRTKKLLMYEAGSRLKSRSLGMAIIYFENVEVAYKFVNDYSWASKFLGQAPRSNVSTRLGVQNWTVQLAPASKDIQWPNVRSGVTAWYTRFVLLNILTVCIVVVFSTPVYIFQALVTFVPFNSRKKVPILHKTVTDADGGLSEVTTRFLFDSVPVILLLLFAVTLPALVGVSDLLAGYWTRSSEHRSRLLKTFVFLVLMVIIFPTIGQATVLNFKAVGWRNISAVFQWECLIAPENGEFYVNYLIGAALVGTLTELLRFHELILFSIYFCCIQSPGELRPLKVTLIYEFQIGSQYAYSIMYFVLFAVYSFLYPVITPVGIIYLLIKHFVDKHNIYFIYGPCETEKSPEIHGLASKCVLSGNFLAQLVLVGYVTTQAKKKKFSFRNLEEDEADKYQEFLVFYAWATLAVWWFVYSCCCRVSWLIPVFYRRPAEPDVAAGPFAPTRRFYYPNRLEVLADDELKALYTKASANRRFAPDVFQELTFLTSYTGLLNQRVAPCHDSSESEDENEGQSNRVPSPLPPLMSLHGRTRRIVDDTRIEIV